MIVRISAKNLKRASRRRLRAVGRKRKPNPSREINLLKKDVVKIAKDKYLRKNEFHLHTNPKYLSKNKTPHVAYTTVKHGKMQRINVITHSKQFKNRRTKALGSNPNKTSISAKKSRISVPFWEHERFLKKNPSGVWRFSDKERKELKKFNKKYLKK